MEKMDKGSSMLSMVRSWLLLQVEDGFPTVARFQQFFGAGRKRDFLNFISFPSTTTPATPTTQQQQQQHTNAATASEQQQSPTVAPSQPKAGAPINRASDKERSLKGRLLPAAASKKENGMTTAVGPKTAAAEKVGWARSLFYLVSEVYFRVASVLGEEVTFVLLLPFLWWHFVTELAESVVFLWCFSCYVGHMFKDLLQLPRPYAHTVARLEHHHDCEYGLPSTHAIAATTLPLCIALHCYRYGLYDPFMYVPLGIAFWLSVCLSRLYLGVHSPSDIFWGTVVGLACFAIWINVNEQVDYYLDTSPVQVMMTMPAVLAALLVIYPAPSQWTNSYGDTATILGALNGGLFHLGMFGKHNAYRLNFADLVNGQTYHWAIARVFVGYLIVFMTRLIMKKASYVVLSSVLPKSDDSIKYRYALEIPAKFINYSVVCLSATAWAPMAMHTLFS